MAFEDNHNPSINEQREADREYLEMGLTNSPIAAEERIRKLKNNPVKQKKSREPGEIKSLVGRIVGGTMLGVGSVAAGLGLMFSVATGKSYETIEPKYLVYWTGACLIAGVGGIIKELCIDYNKKR